MTRLQFVDNFWDSDFLGSHGYEILCQRLKYGKKMCKEVDEYIKERIKAEQMYAKLLLNAVKKIVSVDEMGDLGKSVLQLQRETEKISNIHEIAAKQFLSLEREITEFTLEQNSKRHLAEDSMRKHNQQKQQAYKQATSLQEKYIQKCREKDHAEEASNNAKQSVTVKTKELEKIERTKEKSIEAMEQADQAYKSSIDSLEKSRVHWEQEMENTCAVFQSLEEGRIDFLRDLLWRCTNIDSQMCVEHDQCAENVRQKLEICDVDKDLEEFVDNNKTGSDRPALPSQLLYENYYTRKVSVTNDKSTLSRRPAQPVPPAQTQFRGKPPARSLEPCRPPPEPMLISFDDDNNVLDQSETEAGYTSVSDISDMKQTRPCCKVQRPYTAKKPSEHSVQVGEVVEVVREMTGTPMIQIVKNGRIGLIPKTCVQMMAYV